MINSWDDDELLPLSGIQHLAFCERQWALIHIERVWDENQRTMEGHFLHEQVHDPFFNESRGNCFVARAVPVVSRRLGLTGVADVVEFYRTDDRRMGIEIAGKTGLWHPRPVEYKRGRPKVDDRDAVQLCAQASCLEEMFSISIESGDLFYGQTRHRQRIVFNEELRHRVHELASRMHQLFREGRTPGARPGTNCRLCSLVDHCMPALTKRKKSVKKYLREIFEEMKPIS